MVVGAHARSEEGDPAFAHALLAEALTLFLKGEPNEAKMILISLFGLEKPT